LTRDRGARPAGPSRLSAFFACLLRRTARAASRAACCAISRLRRSTSCVRLRSSRFRLEISRRCCWICTDSFCSTCSRARLSASSFFCSASRAACKLRQLGRLLRGLLLQRGQFRQIGAQRLDHGMLRARQMRQITQIARGLVGIGAIENELERIALAALVGAP
jgi:hypothetical protein